MGLFGAGLNYVGTQETNALNAKLQRETNLINAKIAEEANKTSRDIASEQNEWNYRMFNEQNQWNLEQWNRENEYNSPAAQVQRYIEAGINPIWAISGGNPGNAQQLTSAQAAPAAGADVHVPTMQAPRMQSPDFSGLNGVADSVINGLQGFQRLKIEQQEANTRSRKADSDIDLSSTQANYYNSLAEGIDLNNTFNRETFTTRVHQLQSQIDKTQAEITHLDKDSELYSSKKELMDSQVNLNKALVTKSQAEVKQTLASIYQRDREINIAQQNADTNSFNAQSNEKSVQVSMANFALNVDRFKGEMQNKSNQQIIDYLNNTRGWFDRFVGGSLSTFTAGFDRLVGGHPSHKSIRDVLGELEAAGAVLSQRYFDNPSQSNLEAYTKYFDMINSLPVPQSQPSQVRPASYGVENPSEAW